MSGLLGGIFRGSNLSSILWGSLRGILSPHAPPRLCPRRVLMWILCLLFVVCLCLLLPWSGRPSHPLVAQRMVFLCPTLSFQ